MSGNAVELDKTTMNKLVINKEWEQLIQHLNNKFKITRNSNTGEPIPLNLSEGVIDTLSCLINDLKTGQNLTLNVLKEIYRSLRNSVAFNSKVQHVIGEEIKIIENTQEILEALSNISSTEAVDCIGMILQFLSNAVAKNLNNATQIWEKCKTTLLKLYQVPDYSYHVAALLYNILYLKKTYIPYCSSIYEAVMEACCTLTTNEYDIFLLELFVQDKEFFSLYNTFKPQHRIVILSVLMETDTMGINTFLDSEIIPMISTHFKRTSDNILKTVSTYVDQIEPEEVVLLLEILTKMSANYLMHLQCDTGLLINCAFLLRNIHALGKEYENNFTPIAKLSDAALDNQINKDPSFGFKANLIRLIGNLCWKHRQNQDQAKELDCIPLLLDCCNIDARNPFIMQWVILAIRNLLEDNLENQAVVARMTQQGVVDAATLNQVGITLQNDGLNKIGIVPLDSIKR